MRKHIPHPVTKLYSPYAELDLIYGGTEADAIEESMKIACDLRDILKDDESILYINTLVSELRMAYAMGKRFDHGARRGRNFFITYCAGEVVSKLPVIKHIAESKGHKYLVINGFDLGALNPRHRLEFMGWLRMMRNIGISIILFTAAKPNNHGILGSLRYSSRSVEEVGAYLAKANDEQYENFEQEGNAIEAVADEVVEGVAEEETLSAHEENTPELEEPIHEFADKQEASTLFVADFPETHRPVVPPTQHQATILQHSDSESLKTKDLAVEYV